MALARYRLVQGSYQGIEGDFDAPPTRFASRMEIERRREELELGPHDPFPDTIVESEEDLAARLPGKFEFVELVPEP